MRFQAYMHMVVLNFGFDASRSDYKVVAYKILGNKREKVIMLFDVSREVFDEMPLSEALENELPPILGIVDLGGIFVVVEYDERVWGTRCSIRQMRVYRDVGLWSKGLHD
ncbi:hypothetical protein SASPL_153058 [Salvia splendens]|uniref:Uncharacterized protein n=1 Tax=Salvia splendens TaxID=180675 RepID=A0A8X8W4A9_SALSN|nr:hypothetical protein SASPL_153058 [Salvia splendens]